MTDMPHVSPQAGAELRDAGIDLVATNAADWFLDAKKLFYRFNLKRAGDFTGEEFRLWALKQGLLHPPHPNAWGAVIMHAVRLKLIEDTGTVRHMTIASSHKRRSTVWRSLRQ
jgi:hypothetical protein